MAEQPFDDMTLSLLFLHKRRADKNKGYPSNFLLLLEILVLFKTWCLTGSFFFEISCKGKFPGSAVLNSRSDREPSRKGLHSALPVKRGSLIVFLLKPNTKTFIPREDVNGQLGHRTLVVLCTTAG